MNPSPIEIEIHRRMASDNLNLASSFISIGNTQSARDHVAAALKNIDTFETLVSKALQAKLTGDPATKTPLSAIEI